MLNLVSSLVGPVTGLLDKFVEDKDTKNKLAHEIATMAEKQAHEANMAQVEVNKAEAQHRSLFVAGWRPFVGWICATALLYHFVLNSNYNVWRWLGWGRDTRIACVRHG